MGIFPFQRRFGKDLSVILAFCLFIAGGGSKAKKNEEKTKFPRVNTNYLREGKFLSLFSIVTFKNDQCTTMSSLSGGSTAFRNGTCYTSSECTSNGGTASGNCAAGFGVCCLFAVDTCGSTISRNGTYIRNPNFPGQYGSTTTCTFTINKCNSDVCSLRLDFESFTTNGPTSGTTEFNGGQCQDTLVTQVSSGGTTLVPTICGQNSGQHMYLDLGANSGDSATLTFNFDNAATGGRMWEIKVLQIPCNSELSPDNGCLQYNTGIEGRFTTFNFIPTGSTHLQNQQYSSCIRQELGYCCIRYSVCPDANSFTLGTLDQTDANAMANIENNCGTVDYLGIQGGSADCTTTTPLEVTKFCGRIFSATDTAIANSVVCDCMAPFALSVFTDAFGDAVAGGATMNANAQSRGLCIEWRQLPCN